MPKARARRLHRRGDPYPVLLGEGLIDRVGEELARLWPRRRVAVVTQARIERRHGPRLVKSLQRAKVDATMLRMPEGEEKKSLDTVSALYDRLVRLGFTRDDAVLAFGGGTVGDTAGFVAATFLRGIAYAQMPTTLLAQIDSSIGGKVGVNHPRAKNLIGAIYRPSAVWIDPTLLATLPARDFRSGLFELVKYGFIGVPRLIRRMEQGSLHVHDPGLVDAIADGARRKLEVVREDELETGLRRILNFGHTIGHGLEAAGDYRTLTHGEAVGWGMIGAILLGERRGRLSPSLAERLRIAVRRQGALPHLDHLSTRRVMKAITKDKKIGPKGLRFVLPTALGKVEIVDGFPLAEIEWALGQLRVGGGTKG
jgi:3-dehydroquinate synthase